MPQCPFPGANSPLVPLGEGPGVRAAWTRGAPPTLLPRPFAAPKALPPTHLGPVPHRGRARRPAGRWAAALSRIPIRPPPTSGRRRACQSDVIGPDSRRQAGKPACTKLPTSSTCAACWSNFAATANRAGSVGRAPCSVRNAVGGRPGCCWRVGHQNADFSNFRVVRHFGWPNHPVIPFRSRSRFGRLILAHRLAQFPVRMPMQL